MTADTVGGVWTYAREMVCGLVRRDVEVTLVSFGHMPEPRQVTWADGLPRFDFRPTAFRLEWMQDSAADIEESSEYLLAVIRETQPDILHLSQFCYGGLKVDLPKIVVAHSDVVSWWMAIHGCEPPPGEWIDWYYRTVQDGLSGTTAVVAPTRWMLAQLERYYGPQQQAYVIYNGRSPQLFNPHGEKEQLLLTVGRLWDPAKQVSRLAACDCGWPVVIAGETQHPDQAYRNEDQRIVCEGTLELKGRQTPEQLRSLYARAGIYAATSRYEPFGLAPLEAALSRCAIVASEIPSYREVWADAACYFPADDTAALREVIARLRADRELRRQKAELAYQRARRLFTADRMVQEYLDLYRSLIATRTAVAA